MVYIDPYMRTRMAQPLRVGSPWVSFGPGAPGDVVRWPVVFRLAGAAAVPRIPGLRVHARLGPIVAGDVTEAALSTLAVAPGVLVLEMSRPGGTRDGGPGAAAPMLGTLAENADATALHAAGELGAHAIVAVIDAGLDLRHEAFLDAAGGTRVLAFWDQTDRAGTSPAAQGVGSLTFGSLYLKPDIQRQLQLHAVPATLVRDPQGHGTHVTSIAAGSATHNSPGGVAPAAGIVFVRPDLMAKPGAPPSIGYSLGHIAALEFIRTFAELQGLPVVVNVSLGMNAGAHDGTTLLEAAFDAFCEGGHAPGRVVVKSAGNEHSKRGHAQAQIPAFGALAIEFTVPRNYTDQAYLEAWFDSRADLAFTLIDPSGNRSGAADRAARHAQGSVGGASYVLDVEPFHPDNGDGRLVIELAPANPLGVLPDGLWQLEVVSLKATGTEMIDLWIERLDTMPDLQFGGQHAPNGTLSIPGTARTVITVGALKTAAPLLALTATSSHGLTRDRRAKPDLIAPGGDILAAEATTLDRYCTKSGTSMAAPHVAGGLALILSHFQRLGLPLPCAAQLRGAVVHGAAMPQAQHHPGFGHGVFSADGALKALS